MRLPINILGEAESSNRTGPLLAFYANLSGVRWTWFRRTGHFKSYYHICLGPVIMYFGWEKDGCVW